MIKSTNHGSCPPAIMLTNMGLEMDQSRIILDESPIDGGDRMKYKIIVAFTYYPLVNIQKTMGNHHLSWENSL